MTLEAGARSQLITIERGTAVEDDYTPEGSLTWATLTQAWAQVRFGTGQERRAAAQEGSEQAATFGILKNPITATITTKDRILYLGSTWDIEGWNPTSDNMGIVITATRSE